MTDINAEHLPDAGFWYTSLGKDDPIIRVRHEQCSVEEAYPATFSLPEMRDAYRAAHPAPDPALAVVLKSDRHEDALWYAFTDTGGLPWAPGSSCFEREVWNAYLDLHAAGLLTPDPDSDVKRYDEKRERYCVVRAKFRPTAAEDSTFTLSVTATRKVRVIYRIESGIHYFTSPDVIGGAYYHRDKSKAFDGFKKLLQERVK